MNSISGFIEHIESVDELSSVTIRSGNLKLKSIVLENPDTVDYLTIENQVKVLFKETEVAISTSANPEISMQNQIPCRIEKIEEGKILSRIFLLSDSGAIHSVITSASVSRLGLKPEMKVVALIKTNELMLSV